MNQQMKLWCRIREFMIKNADNCQPFVWVHNDAVMDLNKNMISSLTFELTTKWQHLDFIRGDMTALKKFCVSHGIETGKVK